MVAATVLLIGGTVALAVGISWRHGLLYLLGGAFGVTHYHALFSFTSAWRVFAAGSARGLPLSTMWIAGPSRMRFRLAWHRAASRIAGNADEIDRFRLRLMPLWV